MNADAEALVNQALKAGADQAEIHLTRGASIELDIERGNVVGSGRSESAGGAVRIIKDDRLGFAYFSRPEQAGRAIEAALSASKLAPSIPMRFPGAAPSVSMDHWDDDIARLDPASALDKAKHLIDGASGGGTLSAGVSMGWGKETTANSEGAFVEDQATSLDAYASLVQDGETSVNAWDMQTVQTGDLDTGALGARVAKTVASLTKPTPASTGVGDVILRPNAASELLVHMAIGALDGDDYLEGKTFLAGQDEAAHPGLHVMDAPHDPHGIGSAPYDGEGTPTKDTPLLVDGTVQALLFNTREAARHGRTSSGHCARGSFRSPPGVGTHHVVVDHAKRVPEADLIADIDHGYLVDSVLGAHTANGTTGDFSVTAANVWHIEGGQVTTASKEVALSGNVRQWLLALDGVSTEAKRANGATIPSLRVRNADVSA